MLKSELEKLKQEKESNQLKIENFDNASKSLYKLIRSQIPDKSRKGVGFVSYNVVLPLPVGLFSPLKFDLSNSGLEEFQQPEFEGYGPKHSKSFSEDTSNEVRESPDAPLVEELVSDDKLEKKTVFPTVAKIEFANCNYHQRERVESRNNYTRVNYNYSAKKTHPCAHKNMVPRAVLMKTGLKTVNTARPVNTAHPKTTVYSARPMPKAVNTARPNSAVVNVVRANQVNVVKASACWVWRPTKLNSASITLKNHNYVDARGRSKSGTCPISQTSRNLMDDMLPLGEEPKEGKLLVKELLKLNNMYSVDMKNIVPKECLTCLVAKATLDESILWHRRLGHVNFKTINKLVKENLVRGLPSKRFENDQTCVACLKGKQHKASCKSKIQNSITQPLFMLHMDLFGPTFVSSLMNKKYCLVVTDDYSRFTWVFFLATKDETSGILKRFITEIENLVNKKVKIIRCGNGIEFKNRVMSEFCEEKGIKKEFSAARTPQQNGVAERRNRTLIEAARTMLADSKLPTTFWAEAVNTACYVQNRVLVVKPHNKTPYELFRGRTPALSFMRPFGCHVTILNTLDYLGKFDGKLDEGFFVRYSMNSKAFRVYDIRTRKVEENLHIRFLEDKPIIGGDEPKWLFDIDVLTKSINYVPVVVGTNSNDLVDGSQFDSSLKNAGNDEPQPSCDAGKKDDEGVNKESGIDDKVRPENSTQDINTVGPCINTTSTNVNTVDMSNITTTYPIPSTLNTRIHKDHSLDRVIGDVQFGVQTRRMTKTINEQGRAEKGNPSIKRSKLNRSYARRASAVQVTIGLDLGGFTTWQKIHWLAAHGYTQEEGIDYDEVFAPVAMIEAIRLFLAYASFKDSVVYQMDVKSAFLYGKIEEEVYVCQPPGFEDPKFPDRVYKVEKALYGLHQAPRVWYETLSTYLLENGFQTGTIDKTLFIKKVKCDILLVQVYVDDIIFGSTKKELCTEFEKLMHKKFQMSSMGELTFFLGLQVTQKDDGIFISQEKYVDEL
ncbi:putative ribonuclease H-like domain-containing protein [Tanacetum coccineum]